MTWVLILTMWLGGMQIHVIPGFTSQAKCELAGKSWQKSLRDGDLYMYAPHSTWVCSNL